MNTVNPIIDHFSSEMMDAYTNYLANPDNTAFFRLMKAKESSYADLTGIIYNLDFVKNKNASSLSRMIYALFTEQRFIEVVYYYEEYKSYFIRNKKVTRIYTLSRIEAGLLDSEDNMLKNCTELNDDHHNILYIRLAYFLRIGNLNRAHSIAKDLYICPDCLEPEFVAIIETAIRVSDIGLLRNTLIKAGRNLIESDFVISKKKEIDRLLIKRFLTIIENIVRTKNERLSCRKIS